MRGGALRWYSTGANRGPAVWSAKPFLMRLDTGNGASVFCEQWLLRGSCVDEQSDDVEG
jgi:hypothetical protein